MLLKLLGVAETKLQKLSNTIFQNFDSQTKVIVSIKMSSFLRKNFVKKVVCSKMESLMHLVNYTCFTHFLLTFLQHQVHCFSKFDKYRLFFNQCPPSITSRFLFNAEVLRCGTY